MARPLLGGKYELIREIATGGMAEVFLARQSGFSGFEKLVCIKRILPERAADPEFVQMFLDEARTAADLRHPNIVDLYEIGEDPGDGSPLSRTLFIAMEYVHGHSVRYIQETAAERRIPIPRTLCAQIVLEAARGLHYAHTKRDLRGSPLGIVHRDVSPQNLLVTFEGSTKVCDFGIAKAAGRISTTLAGRVKGKVSYMSPEQAMGRSLDARSDLFSLGVVLYELTAGVRLFPQTGDMLQAIAHAEIEPPHVRAPGYPPMLESIVMKMLAPDPESRFASGAAVAAALEDYATSERQPPSPARLAAYLREIFPANEREAVRVPAVGFIAPGAPTRAEPDATGQPELLLEETSTSPVPVPAAQRTNLPGDPGGFVGRAADLAALAARVAGGTRLVTLLGPGGAGKTRLALRFAREQLAHFTSGGGAGVWFADLASARSLDDVLSAVADALGVPLTRAGAEANSAHLGEALAGRGRLALVLDNFEQVVEHGPATLGRWLAAAPEAFLLVTSRERLRLAGESVHEVLPLGLPVAGEPIVQSEAVQLFIERTRAVRGDFVLSANDAQYVAQIVRMLDGLPLAIELAASRMKVFTPAKLLERLPQRFEILTGARRDTTDRQATLRGAIDWSWSMLSPFEQAALAQASVFRGGFTLDAAEVVLDLSAWPGIAWVPDVVQSLRDKSLLRGWTPPQGELRFGMYESIRDYAAGKLAESGKEALALLRHGEHYVRVATAWAEAVDLHGGLARLRALALDAENLLAIHRRASRGRGSRSASLGVRAILALEPVFATRGPFGAFIRLADEAIGYAKSGGVDDSLLARLLHARGWMRRMSGDVPSARQDFDAALALAEKMRDVTLEGRILRDVGLASWDEGRFEESRLEYARALGLHRKAQDRGFEGRTLGDLANFDQEHGLLEDAQQKYELAIEILREVGDRRAEGIVLGYLGVLLQERERFAVAEAMYGRAIAIHREFGDKRYEAMFTGYRGTLFHEQRDLDEARRSYRHAIRLAREVGDRRQEGFYLSFDGAADAESGRLEDAALALGDARERIDSSGDRLLSTMVSLHRLQLDLATARASNQPGAAEKAARAAASRIEEISAPGTAGWTGKDSMRSLPEASMDIRLALRLLRRALAPVARG